jgi:hypothetical protein
MEVIVLFADADTVALKYAREDSAGAQGYTLHIDRICTDPNLLALYNVLDNPSGPRWRVSEPELSAAEHASPAIRSASRAARKWCWRLSTAASSWTRARNEWVARPPGLRRQLPTRAVAHARLALAGLRAPVAVRPPGVLPRHTR